MTTFRFAWLVALLGCADTEPDVPQVPVDEAAAPAPLDVLARIERAGSTLEWIRPPGAPAGTGAVVISGHTGQTPLLDLDTAEKMRPVELYLALAPEARIPDALAPYATAADRTLAADPVQLTALRDRLVQHASALARKIADETPSIQVLSGTCSAGQIATARSVFGNGYTSAQTCGDHLGFLDSYPTYWYCNGGDCEYPLGRIDGASCPLSNPCDYAQASVHAHAMRSNTNGNPHFISSGHRIRGFAYNCTGNGSLTMNLRYGGGNDWDVQVSVAPGYYTGIYVIGSNLLQARATAIDLVANGSIYDGIPASGGTYQPVEYEVSGNAGTADRGIFCTDTQQSLSIINTSNPSSCGHGFVSWCNGYCGGCFD